MYTSSLLGDKSSIDLSLLVIRMIQFCSKDKDVRQSIPKIIDSINNNELNNGCLEFSRCNFTCRSNSVQCLSDVIWNNPIITLY